MTVTVVKGTCAAGAVQASFENKPLTDITVSVNSQVAGGTASSIRCSDATPTLLAPTPADDTPAGERLR